MSEQNKNRIGAESYYWIFIFVFVGIWIPFRLFVPLSVQVRHTYELPSTACVNRLTSDRWSWQFMREALFVLYLLIPVTGAFMIWTRSSTGIWVHVIFLFALSIWAVIMLSYDVVDIRNANVPPSDPDWNPANLATDKRWCLVYAGQPGTDLVCANTGPCMGPGVSAVSFEDLRVDGPFSFRVAFNVILMVLMLGDFVFTLWTWWGILRAWDETVVPKDPEAAKPMIPQKAEFSFEKEAASIGMRYNLLKDRTK